MKTAVPVTANDAGSKVSLRLLELNSLHAAFWQKEAEIQNRLMENEANLEITNLMVIEEYARPIPIGFKKSYGDLLKQADAARVIGLRHQARKGGQAPKTGPLQQFIIQCVQSFPEISEHKLLQLLKKHPGVKIDQESDCLAGQSS